MKNEMCKSQAVQLDCRKSSCIYNETGNCANKSPAITLNPDTVVCWSMRERQEPRIIDLDNDKNKDTYYDLVINPSEKIIKVSLLFSAMVGDEIWCDLVTYQVLEVLDERPDWQRAGFTYQKLVLKKLKDET